MPHPMENPCAGCQSNCCCDLRKLKLSPSEYKRIYEPFRDRLKTERKGALYELSMQAGLHCPHLNEKNECTIYDARPVECRIFPYTVNQAYKAGPLVLFTYHGKTPCPRKKELFPAHAEARRLVRSLAHDTYGSGKIYLACYESLLYRAFGKLTRILCLKKIAGLFRPAA
jgi:Fe-S-cluster containining protein